MIIETAIISVAAIIVASLMTANAIHKRAVAAEDGDAEARRVLYARRRYAVGRRNDMTGYHGEEAKKAVQSWESEITRVDEEILKLARGEFQVPRTDDVDTRRGMRGLDSAVDTEEFQRRAEETFLPKGTAGREPT